MATGTLIVDDIALQCQVCKHHLIVSKLEPRKYCPLCHSSLEEWTTKWHLLASKNCYSPRKMTLSLHPNNIYACSMVPIFSHMYNQFVAILINTCGHFTWHVWQEVSKHGLRGTMAQIKSKPLLKEITSKTLWPPFIGVKRVCQLKSNQAKSHHKDLYEVYVHPQPTLILKHNTMNHNHMFGYLKSMTIIYSVGFGYANLMPKTFTPYPKTNKETPSSFLSTLIWEYCYMECFVP